MQIFRIGQSIRLKSHLIFLFLWAVYFLCFFNNENENLFVHKVVTIHKSPSILSAKLNSSDYFSTKKNKNVTTKLCEFKIENKTSIYGINFVYSKNIVPDINALLLRPRPFAFHPHFVRLRSTVVRWRSFLCPVPLDAFKTEAAGL